LLVVLQGSLFKALLRHRLVTYLVAAAGLHSILFLLPISEPEASPPIAEKPVKVVKLTAPTRPQTLVVKPTNRVKPRPAIAPKVAVAPKPVIRQRVEQPVPASLPVKTTPAPQKPQTEMATPPKPSPQISPTPTPSPTEQPPASPSQAKSNPLPVPNDPVPEGNTTQDVFARVAQPNGAEQACDDQQETCWRVPDARMREVSKQVLANLQREGYQVEKKELEDDIGMEVYEVSQNGQVKYYLHFLSLMSDSGTFYVPAKTMLSREELEQKAQSAA